MNDKSFNSLLINELYNLQIAFIFCPLKKKSPKRAQDKNLILRSPKNIFFSQINIYLKFQYLNNG